MKEYNTIRVNPNEELYTIQLFNIFGWKLIDSQEFYSESTQIDGVDVKAYGSGFGGGFMKGFTGRDGKVNVRTITNVTNYVTLRFERDTDMPNYDRICELSDEFASLSHNDEPKKPIKRTAVTVIGIAIMLISVFMAIIEHTVAEIWEIAVLILFPIIMIPLTVISWRNYQKRNISYIQMQQRISEIFEEASVLLN